MELFQKKYEIDLSAIIQVNLTYKEYNAQHYLNQKGFILPHSKSDMLLNFALGQVSFDRFIFYLEKSAEHNNDYTKILIASYQFESKFGYKNKEKEGYKALLQLKKESQVNLNFRNEKLINNILHECDTIIN